MEPLRRMSASAQNGAMTGRLETGKGVGVYEDRPLLNEITPLVQTLKIKTFQFKVRKTLRPLILLKPKLKSTNHKCHSKNRAYLRHLHDDKQRIRRRNYSNREWGHLRRGCCTFDQRSETLIFPDRHCIRRRFDATRFHPSRHT